MKNPQIMKPEYRVLYDAVYDVCVVDGCPTGLAKRLAADAVWMRALEASLPPR